MSALPGYVLQLCISPIHFQPAYSTSGSSALSTEQREVQRGLSGSVVCIRRRAEQNNKSLAGKIVPLHVFPVVLLVISPRFHLN